MVNIYPLVRKCLPSPPLSRKSTHSTPRSDPSARLRTRARGMPFDKPFDKLKAVSLSNGSRPRVEPRGSGLILSGASYPDLKIGASAVSSAERFGAVERIKQPIHASRSLY
jgi:hypothetical protein